jgi:hypothetical protein
MMSIPAHRTLLILVTCLALCSAAAGSDGRTGELRTGVVFDAEQGAIYAMQDAGLSAIDVKTGEVRWTTREAGRPLAVTDDAVVALVEPSGRGTAEVVFLHAVDGVELGTISVELGTEIRAGVADGPLEQFRATVFEIEQVLYFSWNAVRYPLRGAPAVGAASPPERAEGVVRLDRGSARAVAIDPTSAPRPPVRSFVMADNERLEGLAGRQFISRDGRHVLASVPIDGGGFDTRYRWSVADPSGSVIAGVDRPIAAAPFVVLEATLIHAVPQRAQRMDDGTFVGHGLRLEAISLQTSELTWTVDLADPRHVGPLPS